MRITRIAFLVIRQKIYWTEIRRDIQGRIYARLTACVRVSERELVHARGRVRERVSKRVSVHTLGRVRVHGIERLRVCEKKCLCACCLHVR